MTTAPEPRSEGEGINLELQIAHMQQRINHVISIKEQSESKYSKEYVKEIKKAGYTLQQRLGLLSMAEKRYMRDLNIYQEGTGI